MLYPNSCYNEPCYKEVEVYMDISVHCDSDLHDSTIVLEFSVIDNHRQLPPELSKVLIVFVPIDLLLL